MKGGSFRDCARRIGMALAGREDPMMKAVRERSGEVQALIYAQTGTGLRALYQSTVDEGTPRRFEELMNALPQGGKVTLAKRG